MLSQSLTIHLLKEIWNKFNKSAIYGLFITFIEFISGLYSKSLLKTYINAKPFFNPFWSASFIAGIFDKIFYVAVRTVSYTGDVLKKIFSGSMISCIYETIYQKIKYHHVLAFIFGLMFLVYSDWWNNLYAAAAALVLFVVFIYKNKKTPLLPSKIDFFMVLFLLSIPLGIIAAQDKTDALRIALIAVSALIFHMCTAMSLNTDKKISGFIKIIAAFIFITAVIAIIQRLAGIEVDPEFVDLANNEGMPGRVFSTMENPNNYAELLVLFIPFMYALLANETKMKMKVLWVIVIGVSIVALGMTYSRSCYVAAVIATVIFLLVYDYKLILPVIIIGILAVPFLPETIFNRILTIGSLSDSSNSYRLYIWEVCVRLAANYGISGMGIGPVSFTSFYKPVAYTNAVKAPHSHMLYLELILEYGIVGFIGFMGYYIRLIRNGFKSVSKACRQQRAYIGAGVGALLGISFVCMAEYIWFYPRDMFAHFIVMGILAAVVRNISKERNGDAK